VSDEAGDEDEYSVSRALWIRGFAFQGRVQPQAAHEPVVVGQWARLRRPSKALRRCGCHLAGMVSRARGTSTHEPWSRNDLNGTRSAEAGTVTSFSVAG
jgi:hypothetical protein